MNIECFFQMVNDIVNYFVVEFDYVVGVVSVVDYLCKFWDFIMCWVIIVYVEVGGEGLGVMGKEVVWELVICEVVVC